jgi:hypothetical protein
MHGRKVKVFFPQTMLYLLGHYQGALLENPPHSVHQWAIPFPPAVAKVNGDLAKLKPTFAHRVSIQAHCSGLDKSQKLHAEMHSRRNAIAETACRQERLGFSRKRYLTALADNYPWPTTAHRATSTQVRSPGNKSFRYRQLL